MSVLYDAAAFASGFMPQMKLGSYLFSLNTAAFQELNRKTEYRWAAVERHGQDDALQYTGPGDDTVELPGVIYPSYRGGGGQLTQLRALAAQAQPQSLIDGMGNVYGRWVITGVDEKQSLFAAFGQPRKQEFTLRLRRFDGGPSNLLTALAAQLGGGGLVTGAQKLLSQAQSGVTSLTGVSNLL